MEEYNLTFMEAMDVVLQGGYVVGDDFAKGIYLKLNDAKIVSVWDFNKDGIMHYQELICLTITHGILNQKYKKLEFLTQAELYK